MLCWLMIKVLFSFKKKFKIFQILRYIEFYGTYIKYQIYI